MEGGRESRWNGIVPWQIGNDAQRTSRKAKRNVEGALIGGGRGSRIPSGSGSGAW